MKKATIATDGKKGSGEAKAAAEDRKWMARAIALSEKGMRSGQGGPFGALIVKDGKLIAGGCNQVLASGDPTAHAEITAIRAACRSLGSFLLAGCDLFTTCEPCPMCLGAAYWARVDRIVYANSRRDAAAIGFSDALIYSELARPLAGRRLPMVRIMRKEALPAFREWAVKADKTNY